MLTPRLCITLALLVISNFAFAEEGEQTTMTQTTNAASPLDYTVTDIDGKPHDLRQHKGRVVMFVNVASKCGMTPQYEGLEALYRKYKDQGLVILGFPANNFRGQEPGTDEQIKQFCSTKYNVSFPMMSKVSVKGDDKAAVYRHLTEPTTAGPHAGEIGWNFAKFLVGRDGKIAARFDPQIKPDDPKLVASVEQALASK